MGGGNVCLGSHDDQFCGGAMEARCHSFFRAARAGLALLARCQFQSGPGTARRSRLPCQRAPVALERESSTPPRSRRAPFKGQSIVDDPFWLQGGARTLVRDVPSSGRGRFAFGISNGHLTGLALRRPARGQRAAGGRRARSGHHGSAWRGAALARPTRCTVVSPCAWTVTETEIEAEGAPEGGLPAGRAGTIPQVSGHHWGAKPPENRQVW
jgi:hypothetical protein